jgi:hypothetical protein
MKASSEQFCYELMHQSLHWNFRKHFAIVVKNSEHGTGFTIPSGQSASHVLRKGNRGIITLEFCFGFFGAEPEDVYWHRPSY